MPPIRILPDRVANQIAAGEVIERPAAVIKELVENALDSGAARIEVEFRHGGRSYMRVEDDGCGMSQDDALLALERHATSKITSAADLNEILSFGFRGEALPSIASVSRFTMQTRSEKSDVGTEILVNGGRIEHVHECGRPIGTRIEVAQLFNSVPARRKFLKSDNTEATHIINFVRLYALAFPEVSFTLLENGRQLFHSPVCNDLKTRVREIFGSQISDALLPLPASGGEMRLNGLIGKPTLTRSSRHELVTFINRRPVDSPALNYAIIESYQESLPRGRYPVAFVFLEINPALVDVNVHPAKKEVRLRNESEVRGFVINGILDCLRSMDPVVLKRKRESSSSKDAPLTEPPAIQEGISPQSHSSALHIPKPPPAFRPPSSTSSFEPGRRTVALDTLPSAKNPEADISWRYIGPLHNHYILFETNAGLLVLDLKAAAERIWFERLQKQFREGNLERQNLLLPIPLELEPISAALLLENLAFIRKHGLDLEEFGRNFFRIEAIPSWMDPEDAEPFVREMIAALREGRIRPGNIEMAGEEVARLAVAKAVRPAKLTGEDDAKLLLKDLFACKYPLTSPRGRLTFFELAQSELQHRFRQ